MDLAALVKRSLDRCEIDFAPSILIQCSPLLIVLFNAVQLSYNRSRGWNELIQWEGYIRF